MLAETAPHAFENGLSLPALGRDVSARVAGLRAVGSRLLDDGAAKRRSFVLELIDQAPPSGTEYAPRESSARLHHVADLEFLDDDDRVTLAESRRDFVKHMVALTTHLSVQDCDAVLGLLPVLGTFLFAADVSLGAREPIRGRVQMFRILDAVAVAVGDDVDHAAVERHDGRRSGDRLIDLDLVDQAREPLSGLAPERARLRLADRLPVDDRTHVAELGEADHGAVKSPHLRVRLAKRQRITTLAFESRSPRQLGEAALPRLVKFHEKLGADVPRHVG